MQTNHFRKRKKKKLNRSSMKRKNKPTILQSVNSMHECARTVGDMAMRGYKNLDISCFITTEWQFETSRFWWTSRILSCLFLFFYLIFPMCVNHSSQYAIIEVPVFLFFPSSITVAIEFINFNQLELQYGSLFFHCLLCVSIEWIRLLLILFNIQTNFWNWRRHDVILLQALIILPL